MQNINLTPILQAVIVLLATLITYKLVPWIKSKTTAQQQENLRAAVRVLVFAAEQIFGAGKGKEKLEYVCEKLRERGYDVSLPDIEAMVYQNFSIEKKWDNDAGNGPAIDDGINLESMTYEQLILFAMDNGFGIPEDGDLHGQNKEQIRQSMLQWLYNKLQFADPDEPPDSRE